MLHSLHIKSNLGALHTRCPFHFTENVLLSSDKVGDEKGDGVGWNHKGA